eukprot:scaffold3826_cov78-Phaeocystis_antarctica.AAC.3
MFTLQLGIPVNVEQPESKYLSSELWGHRLHAPSDQAVYNGERFWRSIQSSVGRREGTHAHCRAKSVAIAHEAELHGDIDTRPCGSPDTRPYASTLLRPERDLPARILHEPYLLGDLGVRLQLSGDAQCWPAVLHCSQDDLKIRTQLSGGVLERGASLHHGSQDNFAIRPQLRGGVLEMTSLVPHCIEHDVTIRPQPCPQFMCRIP